MTIMSMMSMMSMMSTTTSETSAWGFCWDQCCFSPKVLLRIAVNLSEGYGHIPEDRKVSRPLANYTLKHLSYK